MNSVQTILAILIFTLIVSCNNNDDSNDSDDPKVAALTNSNGWKLDSAFIDPEYLVNDSTSTMDFFDIMPECVWDDVTYYKSDKTWAFEDNVDDCDNDPDNNTKDNGTWHFSENKSILYASTRNRVDTFEYRIIQIDASNLVYELTIELNNSNYDVIYYQTPAQQ